MVEVLCAKSYKVCASHCRGRIKISEAKFVYLRDNNELAFVESMQVHDNIEADLALDYVIIQAAIVRLARTSCSSLRQISASLFKE